ncbi:hypothetical protein TeGR_g3056 [Tetraparma gracilis]|uniref:ATP synthase protein MI25 n=1 Tax=Tetraparma gracilis TaxID=2962635 RepID=A0ABQ6N4T4_9STRA|nr:hypothetical protein TeGR_g3056 [Tetraparma gracilis]
MGSVECTLSVSLIAAVVLVCTSYLSLEIAEWNITLLVDGIIALGSALYVLSKFISVNKTLCKEVPWALLSQRTCIDEMIMEAVDKGDEKRQWELSACRQKISDMIARCEKLPAIKVWGLITLKGENIAKIAAVVGASFVSAVLRSGTMLDIQEEAVEL